MYPTAAAILAGGEGTRMSSVAPFKPFVKIAGRPLVVQLVEVLKGAGVSDIVIAFHRSGKGKPEMLEIDRLGVGYFFVETPSSLHTLHEVVKKGATGSKSHLVVSMADTVISQRDITEFIQFLSLIHI